MDFGTAPGQLSQTNAASWPSTERAGRRTERTSTEGARIGRLAIPTRDASHVLGSALWTLLDVVRRRAGADVLVVDDARRLDAGVAERADAAAGKLGIRLRRMGRAERIDFCESLGRAASVDPSLVRFALLDDTAPGAAYGAARNVMLLASAGEAILTMDDDVGGWLAPAPDRESGVALAGGDPTHFSFHGGLAEALDSVRPSQRSLLRVHESVLGRTAAEILATVSSASAPSSPSTVTSRKADDNARVVASATGFVGDVATPNPLHYLTQTGSSRDRLVAEEATFHEAWSSRQAIRAPRRLTIGDGIVWSTGAAAYDARQLLPPFLPVMRGEGLIWGATVRACHSGLLAYLPWVVPHLPLTLRTASHEGMAAHAGFTTSSLLYQLTCERNEACLSMPLEDRMRALGEHLLSIGMLPEHDFAMQVAERRTAQDMAVESALSSSLLRYDAEPRHWALQVQMHIELLRSARHGPAYEVPPDLAERFGAERGAAVCRELVRRYGELLLAWPALWEAALALRGH